MSTLTAASRQWSSRPADERFSSLADMIAMLQARRERSVAALRTFGSLRAEAVDGDVVLVGAKGQAGLTNHAFGQLATIARAPASYLGALPATLAAQNLNHGLAASRGHDPEDKAIVLLDRAPAGDLTVRALTTDSYSRVWDVDIATRLAEFVGQNAGWVNPPAYPSCDADRQRPGYDPKTNTVPSGLYAGDRDMFAYLVDGGHILDESPKGLYRGIFVRHSEVGESSLSFTGFVFDRTCGNHFIFGARDITAVRVRHVGDADTRAWGKVASEVRAYAASGSDGIVKRIRGAKSLVLGANKADALDALLKMVASKRVADLSKPTLEAAIETAERREDRYGAPYTLWAAASGLTENSQELANADARSKVDRAAGKLLEVVEF